MQFNEIKTHRGAIEDRVLELKELLDGPEGVTKLADFLLDPETYGIDCSEELQAMLLAMQPATEQLLPRVHPTVWEPFRAN